MEQLPKIDYWMLNVMVDALQKEYDRHKKESGISKQLSEIAKKEGFDAAVAAEKEIQDNRFHSLGKIWLSMRKVEEIREAYTNAVIKTS